MGSLRRDPVADIELVDGGDYVVQENAVARRQRQIAADVLELYCRFRAKDEPEMPQKTWVELLEKTIPKLKVRETTRVEETILDGAGHGVVLRATPTSVFLRSWWWNPFFGVRHDRGFRALLPPSLPPWLTPVCLRRHLSTSDNSAHAIFGASRRGSRSSSANKA